MDVGDVSERAAKAGVGLSHENGGTALRLPSDLVIAYNPKSEGCYFQPSQRNASPRSRNTRLEKHPSVNVLNIRVMPRLR
jgi:hypothetical protein